jgi:hypothetical protein
MERFGNADIDIISPQTLICEGLNGRARSTAVDVLQRHVPLYRSLVAGGSNQ